MQIATYQGETSVNDLITRIYGPLSASKLAEVKRALLARNPSLNRIKQMGNGATIVLPDAGEPAQGQSVSPEQMIQQYFNQALAPRLAQATDEIDGLLASQQASLDATIKLVKSSPLSRRLSESDPAIQEKNREIITAAQAELKRLRATQTELGAVLKTISGSVKK